MMMCEESAKKFVPAIRRQLVIEMVKLGRKQSEVAALLGITPAAVTQYVKGKRAKVSLNESEKRDARKIALKDSIDEDAICSLCRKMRKRSSH